ncbi:hypothetical protein PJ985_10710 [Streptomyces sp. ACA25]|uniref:hypothetical protein n=1 Tax=Streptomyces sp. ACA25 TaxID=3022596 RepID=UPI002308053A|nr:hypothetical protein [Streptomyces sp. ACA25]MDB1088035.1 hypothetical protein [Streptomyces sp. ACA25]
MSSGNNGTGTSPEGGDDPFGYLYRQEDGQAAAPVPPASYHQVRPVGERSYGGQQGGYGYPQSQGRQAQQPDTHYGAPETQPGGPGGYGPYGKGAGNGTGDGGPEPRRNGLLIGAIAVVTAVVLGVGAAILFSNNGADDSAIDNSGASAGVDDDQDEDTDDQDQDDEDDDEDEEDEDEDEFAYPEAVLAELDRTNGVQLGSGHVEGARSDDGTYLAEMDNPGAMASWYFDFDGPPGEYRLYFGYSVADDQLMSFAVNSDTDARTDPINFKDYVGDASKRNWYSTWKLVSLQEGENVIHLGCGTEDKCDVLVDKIEITEVDDPPGWAG